MKPIPCTKNLRPTDISRFNWRKLLFYLSPPLLALSVILFTHFKTDLSAFIIAGDNAEEVLLASEMQSGTLSRRYLLSVNAVNKPKVSKAFLQTLQQGLREIEGVVDVWSPGQQTNVTKSIQTLYAPYSSAFFSLTPEQDLAQLFSSEGLQQRAQLLKNLLLSPQGGMLKKLAIQDPLLLTLNAFQSVGGQMQQLAAEDDKYRNLVLETAMAGLDAPQQSHIQAEINRVFENLNQSYSGNYKLEMTGVPVFSTAIQTLIQGDIFRVSIISTIALVFLFLLVFRSFSIMFQVFTLLAIVILSSILCTQLMFGYVHGMTVAIGSTLAGICIDYPIHAAAHAQSVNSIQRTAVIVKIWPSMLMGGMTTMIGYIALGISGYPGFQQVAVYATTGIFVSLILTRFVFPQLNSSSNTRQLHVPFINVWSSFCQQFRPWIIMLLLIMLVASSYGLKSLHWLQDMQDLTPELNYLKLNDKNIRSRMTSIEPGRFVLVTGENAEAALQKAEEVYPLLEQLKIQGDLSDYYALYPWLLSAQKQLLNQSLLHKYLTPENQLYWQHALKQQGLSTKRLGTFDYTSYGVLTLEQVLATPVKKLIDSRVIIGKQQTIIMIWLAEHQPEMIQKVMDKIEGAQYFSQRDMLNNMTRDYTDRAQTLLTIGLVLIILVLFSRYKSLVKTLQTLLPALLAAFLILAIWSFTGEAVSFLHLVGFLLVVAICVDYGIFYQENRGGDITLTYQAMAASMLTSALAFGSLITAETASLRILAGVVAVGVVLGFLFCPLIIKTGKQT